MMLFIANNEVALHPFIWQTLWALGSLNREKYIRVLRKKNIFSIDKTVSILFNLLTTAE